MLKKHSISKLLSFCLHKGLEITAKIFISLPEGQRRWHSQLFSKIAILTQILAQVNQGVFGKCIYGNRLCSLRIPAKYIKLYGAQEKILSALRTVQRC